tara:strand:+ start:272427 stop:273059 length:633 start_codon:yes stop_codon:yes gene_type:complete
MVKVYDDTRFLGKDEETLSKIILTGDTKQRWAKETDVFSDAMIAHMGITQDTVLLDYGAGIGRIAKSLIEKTNCSVIGVDISPDMLRESFSYVAHPNFTSMSLTKYQFLVNAGKLTVDAAYSIWALQHCDFEPAYQTILKSLPQGAPFFIANTLTRCVPVAPQGWADDGINIRRRLKSDFDLSRDATAELTPHLPSDHHNRVFCEFMTKM